MARRRRLTKRDEAVARTYARTIDLDDCDDAEAVAYFCAVLLLEIDRLRAKNDKKKRRVAA